MDRKEGRYLLDHAIYYRMWYNITMKQRQKLVKPIKRIVQAMENKTVLATIKVMDKILDSIVIFLLYTFAIFAVMMILVQFK